MSAPIVARSVASASTVKPLALSPSSRDSPDSTNTPPADPLITKVWAIPPRPKPGRKPSLETPPTKRKQQNRAAQRAFRERRAARVDELEDEKRKEQLQFDEQRKELQDQLDEERKFYQHNVTEWRIRAEHWQRIASDQERLRLEREQEMDELRRQLEQYRVGAWARDSRPLLAPPLDTPWDRSSRTLPALPIATDSLDCSRCGENGRCSCLEKIDRLIGSVDKTCGGCGDGGKCGCVEHIDRMVIAADQNPVQEDHKIKEEVDDEMEIDFTARFSKKPGASLQDAIIIDQDTPSYTSPIATDMQCGFCTDDSNCICKASAAQAAALASIPRRHLPAPALISPPSSVAGDAPRPPKRLQPAEPVSAAKGPGSCPACMNDPERRQFCMSMAAAMPPPPLPAKDAVSSAAAASPAGSAGNSRYGSIDAVACSVAYDKLSQNPNFSKHKTDIDFLRHIRPAPAPYDSSSDSARRYPVEVNSSSVMEAAEALDDMRRSRPLLSGRAYSDQ